MNAFVDTGAQDFANAGINYNSDTIKAVLTTNAVALTYDSAGNINNVQFYSDISSSVIGSAVALGTKSDPAGVLKAADVTFPAVSSASTVSRVWVYKDTGVTTTSQLILMYDGNGTFAVIPNGGDIVCHWDTGAITGVSGVAII